MKARKERCGTCRFWVQGKVYANQGNCHRYAPRPGAGLQYWVTTQDIHWCGEWEGKEDSRTRASDEGDGGA